MANDFSKITIDGTTYNVKVPNKLTVGSKTFDGSSAVTIAASDLGLSNALQFIGETTTALSDGSTTSSIKIGSTTHTAATGDVVLYGAKEFVWQGSMWKELGDGSSHALKTISISAGGGLTGGGTLEANRTISHADTSSQASVSASGRRYITGVTLDGYGHVTGLSTGTETVADSNTTYSLSKSGSTITLTGSDGSTTSVTDANTTYSVPVNATTSAVAPSACTSNGFYYVSSNTNSLTDKDGNPFLQYHTGSADFRILATAYSASWIQQIATDFRSEHVYVRRCENGTWKPWTKIAQTSEIPSVPTKVSDLTNDSKFVTADQNMTIKWDGSINSNPSWMLAWSDSGSTIQGVAPSTITAGNATKLNGQAASYYAKATAGVYLVKGNTTGTEGTWTGTSSDFTDYYDGLVVAYDIGIAGASTTTLNINGKGAKTVYLRGTTKLTTHYAVGTIILLVYSADEDCWYKADYDANTNTQVRVYRQDASSYNKDYPLIASRTVAADLGTVGTESSYEAVYGLISDTAANIPTTNPYTGESKFKKVTATTFAGGTATTSANGLMSAADKTKLDETYGANTITSLYVANGDTSATSINDTGITCSINEVEIEMNGDSYNYCSGQFEVPIVAGDGISITKNSSNKAAIGWPLADRIKAGTGTLSVCCGNSTSATGNYSMAVNSANTAAGLYSFAAGLGNTANAFQAVFGRNATNSSGPGTATTAGDIFKIGNGTSTLALGNAMRVTTAGKVYGLSSFGSSGADYAEMWEWADGNPDNEDRRGKFVTVDENNKIRIATTDDEYILGIISATPCVVGDVQSENWREMYLKDVFGQPIVKKVDVPEHTDEETGELVKAHTEEQWVLNPEYDPTRPYVSRDERQEWAAVGLMGKLVVIDDGTCVAGRYCKLTGNGTATASTDKNDWRVLKRTDSTHVQILYR